MDRVVERYLKIWETIKFHRFQHFTTTCISEFYEAYARIVPKSKGWMKITG